MILSAICLSLFAMRTIFIFTVIKSTSIAIDESCSILIQFQCISEQFLSRSIQISTVDKNFNAANLLRSYAVAVKWATNYSYLGSLYDLRVRLLLV